MREKKLSNKPRICGKMKMFFPKTQARLLQLVVNLDGNRSWGWNSQ